MTERDFVYWLQGFLELKEESNKQEPLTLDAKQVFCIKEHLSLVLTKVTGPSVVKRFPVGNGRIC